jgi:putative membrane protein
MDTRKRLVLEQEPVTPPGPAPLPRTELQAHTDDSAPLPLAAEGGRRPGEGPLPRTLLTGLALTGSLLLLHTLHALYTLLTESPLLGIAWSIAFALVLGAGARATWRMWHKFRTLKRQQNMRIRAEHLLAHHGVSEGIAFCERLAREAGVQGSAEYRRWKELVNATHNDREVLQTYGRVVLTAADARALERVSSHAGDVAVMVAVSYFPVVDMLLVLWRQLKLVEEVSAAYGMDPGYWGRIRLLRTVLRNMALAGAAEIATEVGVEVLGAGVAARLSGALAQGVAAGVLTARLGLRTMDACRAIAWEPEQRPRLRQVTGGMVEKARQYLLDGNRDPGQG